jgi:peptide chain release factor 2
LIALTIVSKKSKNSWCIFDFAQKEKEIAAYQKKSGDPDLWNDNEEAQRVMITLADLRSEVDEWLTLQKLIQDSIELAEMGEESMRPELEAELEQVERLLEKKEFNLMLSGKYDKGNALLAIHAGAGGTDSQDWAGMLERMYLRWAERQGFEAETLDATPGEEAGLKSATIAITGPYAYGYLRSEKGVHRLVRLSPFDSAHRRHTSFALIEILPEVAEDNEIKIPAEDIRIDVYKSSGAGGQNVQKNATAVRITHIPTGLVVSCQNERSQIQNRANAMRVLRSRLLEMKQEQQAEELSELRGEYTKAEWGSQIRSYVLHPYHMVKDHRTDYEMGNTQAVLDGDLAGFMEAYLKMKE